MLFAVLLGLHGTSIAGIYVSANVLMAGHFSKERTAASGVLIDSDVQSFSISEARNDVQDA